MSLMNEMLRDLEDGRRNGRRTSAADAHLSDSGLLSSNPSTTWIPALIAFVVVASLLIWQQIKVKPESVDATKVATEVAEVAEVKAAAVSKPAILTTNYYPALIATMDATAQQLEKKPKPESITAIELNAKALEENKQKQITQLLAEASRAFAQDRLLAPADDNACSRYREILSLDPNNTEALSGLESAAMRYIDLARGYADEGNSVRAKALLQRAGAVMPENTGIREVIENTRKMIMADFIKPASSFTDSNQVTALESNNKARVESNNPNNNSLDDSAPLSKNSQGVMTMGQPMPASASIRVREDGWQDADTARKAKNLFSKGKSTEALQLLRNFLQQQPASEQSLSVLLHALIDRTELDEAQQWLSRSTTLAATDAVEYRAHIEVARDNISEAIVLLEQNLQEAQHDYSYRVLLAGLYNKSGDNAKSVQAYRALLKDHGNKSEYWLGLAVGLDSMQLKDEALQAFQQSINPNQSENVQRYIEARISALSS